MPLFSCFVLHSADHSDEEHDITLNRYWSQDY